MSKKIRTHVPHLTVPLCRCVKPFCLPRASLVSSASTCARGGSQKSKGQGERTQGEKQGRLYSVEAVSTVLSIYFRLVLVESRVGISPFLRARWRSFLQMYYTGAYEVLFLFSLFRKLPLHPVSHLAEPRLARRWGGCSVSMAGTRLAGRESATLNGSRCHLFLPLPRVHPCPARQIRGQTV